MHFCLLEFIGQGKVNGNYIDSFIWGDMPQPQLSILNRSLILLYTVMVIIMQ